MNYDHVMIRHLRIEDLDRVQAFCSEQIEKSGDILTKLRISSKQYAWEMKRLRQSWLAEQRYIAYVAVSEDAAGETFLGYGAALITNQAQFFEVSTLASIGELWVDPDHRGHGIGRTLVSAILDEIRSIGISVVTAHLGGDELKNTEFFDKLGFSAGAVEMRLTV